MGAGTIDRKAAGTNKDIERFDTWSSTYQESLFWRYYFLPLHDKLVSLAGDVGNMALADVGCGTGDMLRRFSRGGASRLVGADMSEGMLDVARRYSGATDGMEYFFASAESLPVGDSEFDLVTSCIAFHHFPDPEGAVREMARILKPGGRIMICDLNGEGLLGRVFLAFGRWKRADERYFDPASLMELVSGAGFEDVSVRRIRRFPPTMLVQAVRR